MRLFKAVTGGVLWSSLLLAALPTFAKDPSDMTISGAGSSFIAPLFSKWAAEFKANHGAAINYQSVGSGAGIDQIKKKTVLFGASDEPMNAEDLAKNGLVQFPSAIGGVVPVYNLKGLTKPLVFNGQVLGSIYLGKIKKWNDPR